MKDVASAIALAEKLPKYERANPSRDKAPKASKANDGGDCRNSSEHKGRKQGSCATAKEVVMRHLQQEQLREVLPKEKAGECCPDQARQGQYGTDEGGHGQARRGSQRLASSSKPLKKKFLYIDVTLNDKATYERW